MGSRAEVVCNGGEAPQVNTKSQHYKRTVRRGASVMVWWSEAAERRSGAVPRGNVRPRGTAATGGPWRAWRTTTLHRVCPAAASGWLDLSCVAECCVVA